MIESWKQGVFGAIVVIAALVIAGGLQAWSLEHGPADAIVPVLVSYQHDAPVTFSAPRDALPYASSKAGFKVSPPTYLPPNYALVEIDIPAGEPSRVFFRAVGTDAQFYVGVLLVPAASKVDPSNVIASPTKHSQIAKFVHLEATIYTLSTPTQQVSLQPGGASPLTDQEAVRILTSMQQN